MAGFKAKKRGQRFEDFIEQSLRLASFAVLNLPPAGIKWIGKNKTVSQKISCDFIIGKNGKTLLIDTKSTSQKRYSFSASMTKPHQIKDLYRFKRETGCFKAGFVVCFQKTGDICFFNIEKLWELEPHEALSIKDGTLLGKHESISLNWDQLLK